MLHVGIVLIYVIAGSCQTCWRHDVGPMVLRSKFKFQQPGSYYRTLTGSGNNQRQIDLFSTLEINAYARSFAVQTQKLNFNQYLY